MNFKKIQIRQRLNIGFAIVILLMITITATAAFQLVKDKLRIGIIVNDRIPTTVLVNTIKSDLNEILGHMRSIVVQEDASRNQVEIELLQQSSQYIDDNFVKLQPMMQDSEEGKQLLGDLDIRRTSFQSAQANFVNAIKDQNMDQAKALMRTQVHSFAEAYILAVDNVIEYQGKLAERAGAEAESAIQNAIIVIGALAAVATLVGIVVAILVSRGIIRPLNDAVDVAERVAGGNLSGVITVQYQDEIGKLMLALQDMNQSLARIVGEVRNGTDAISIDSVQIAEGTAQLSLRTEQQASSLHNTATSVSELNHTVLQNADSAEQANRLVNATTLIASKGSDVVAEVIKTMGMIKSSSKRISDIISVIDGIAFQTNILALNAAVEAARAGAEGRGFAVVASEVRNLAHRSADAAKEIKLLINDSVSSVEAGNALVDDAGLAMGEIMASVKKVAEIMAEITRSTREQSTGIDSVTQAIVEMSSMTQQNAAMVEEATAATESMRDRAAALGQAVSVFILADSEEHGGFKERAESEIRTLTVKRGWMARLKLLPSKERRRA